MVEIRHRETGEVLMRMEGSTLAGAYLAGAELSGADLARADLTGAELQGARLDGANLVGAALQHADLRGASLVRASLHRANLALAIMWGVECVRADFSKANLRSADLSGAGLERASLRKASLSFARLIGANLRHADLRGADLCGADFSKADLTNASLHGAVYGYAVRGGIDYSNRTYQSYWNITRSEGARPEGFQWLQCGARRRVEVVVRCQAAWERIQWMLPAKRRELRGDDDSDERRNRLVVPAGSIEELHAVLGLMEELTDYTGGWAADRYGPVEVRLEGSHASSKELREIWERIRAGEAPGVAFTAVKGPSYRRRERLRSVGRRGTRTSSARQPIEIRHQRTGDVLHRVDGDSLAEADLAGAELAGANLAGADLSGAKIQGAWLEGAELAGATLRGADLRGAIFFDASLGRADLRGADLRGCRGGSAKLAQAKLSGANLAGANLSHADLTGADLTGAILAGVWLDNAELCGADFTGTRPEAAFLRCAGFLARHDNRTRWPEGFHPWRHGARQIGWFIPERGPEAPGIDEAQAIEIARRAVAANAGRGSRADYEARRNGDTWCVIAKVYGRLGSDSAEEDRPLGRDSVQIERHGRVTSYQHHGYL